MGLQSSVPGVEGVPDVGRGCVIAVGGPGKTCHSGLYSLAFMIGNVYDAQETDWRMSLVHSGVASCIRRRDAFQLHVCLGPKTSLSLCYEVQRAVVMRYRGTGFQHSFSGMDALCLPYLPMIVAQ